MVTEPSPVHGDAVSTLRELAYQQVEAAVIVMNVDGRIVDWNDGATRLFGWTPSEAIGETWEGLAGPVAADPDPRRAEIQALLEGGRGYTGELTVGTRDGRRIPILVSGGLVRDDTGVVVGSIGIAIDDSRRSHAEERFEVAFQASPVASLMTSGSRQLILDVNRAFEALSGLSRADAIGRTANELGLWEDAAVAAAVQDLTRKQRPLTDRAITFRVATGGMVHARVSGRPITLAGGPAYLWMAVDETDRVRAEEELRSTAARLAAVVEASPLALTLLDGDGIIELWNPAAERLLGWTAAEVIGRPNPIHSTTGDSSLEQLRTVRRTGEPTTVITTVADRLGREVRVEIALAPVFDAEGAIAGVLAIGTDVGDRERLQEQLRDAQRMESIGLLAGGIAHDFNNLMLAIGGNASLALRAVGTDHPVAADLDEIVQATDRAVALTRQLLAFSRRQVMRPEVVDLVDAANEMVPMLRRLLGPAITITVTHDGTPAWVRADPGQIQQVLLNLAVNARDAMPDGGEIRMSLTVEESPDGSSPGLVRLSVADTGTGMDDSVRVHIFEPFFTTKPAGLGTGLGLSVVHGILEQSGGHIEVDSRPGAGTTFHIDLPRVDGAGEGDPEPEPPAERVASGRRATILLVEDEQAIRTLARRVLESRGHRVVEAEDGLAGLEIATAMSSIDLVLTDLTMPRMGGEEMASRITELRPDVPIVFMSGFGESVLAADGVLDPAIRLLAKPFAIDDLASMIDRTLQESV